MDSSNKKDAVYLTGYISGSCDTINESDESDLVLENAALSTPVRDCTKLQIGLYLEPSVL